MENLSYLKRNLFRNYSPMPGILQIPSPFYFLFLPMLSCALTFRGALYFNKAQIEGVNFGECQARTPENYKRICDHVSVKII